MKGNPDGSLSNYPSLRILKASGFIDSLGRAAKAARLLSYAARSAQRRPDLILLRIRQLGVVRQDRLQVLALLHSTPDHPAQQTQCNRHTPSPPNSKLPSGQYIGAVDKVLFLKIDSIFIYKLFCITE